MKWGILMKKCLSFVLIFVFLFVLIGCGKQTYTVPISCKKILYEEQNIELSVSAQEEIAAILRGAEWISDLPNCASDYEFAVSDKKLRYHASCGTMADIRDHSSAKLSEKDRVRINALILFQEDIEHTGYIASLAIYQYHWSGYGISQKTLSASSLAYEMIDALSDMKETGEIVPKISDEIFSDDDFLFAGALPVTPGTKWIVADGLYRVNPELDEICRVETHLGEGNVLQMDENFRNMLRDAWYYYPYDYHSGTYENGELTLNSMYHADSSVDIHVKEIALSKKDKNRIVLDIYSSKDQTLTIYLSSQQSDDNLAEGDAETLTFAKGETKTVEMTFGGFPYTYWVTVTADNTKVNITIFE